MTNQSSAATVETTPVTLAFDTHMDSAGRKLAKTREALARFDALMAKVRPYTGP